MHSGSTDPCRNDPRAACTGAISPRLNQYAGWCHNYQCDTLTSSHCFKISVERTMHQHRSPFTIHHSSSLTREISWVYQTTIFIFKTKEASLETAPAGGAVACKQDNQGPRPQGGQRGEKKREQEHKTQKASRKKRAPSTFSLGCQKSQKSSLNSSSASLPREAIRRGIGISKRLT
jgi:hypothetical protein